MIINKILLIITILSLSINDEVDKSNLAYCHIPVAKPNTPSEQSTSSLGAKHKSPRSKGLRTPALRTAKKRGKTREKT